MTATLLPAKTTIAALVAGLLVVTLSGCTAPTRPVDVPAPLYQVGDHWEWSWHSFKGNSSANARLTTRVEAVTHAELNGTTYPAARLADVRRVPSANGGVRWENTTRWVTLDGANLDQTLRVTLVRPGQSPSTSIVQRSFDAPCATWFGDHPAGSFWNVTCSFTAAQGSHRARGQVSTSYHNLGRDTIDSPAGSYYAWHISANETFDHGAPERTDFWYAPSVCTIARSATIRGETVEGLVLESGSCLNAGA